MMTRMTRRTGVALTGIAAVLGASLLASPAAAADGTNFYVPKPNHGAVEQIADLTSQGDKADADLIEAMVDTPQAVWFEGGTPKQVEQDVRNTVARAEAKKSVPVLVVYNIPTATARSSRLEARPAPTSTWPGSTDSPRASVTPRWS